MAENKTNLIINYLPQTFTQEDLESLFCSIGSVKSAKVICDRNTGFSYGFGFVDFYTPDDAQLAINNLNGLEVQGKVIKVALARPPGENTKGANLYVRNIPTFYTDEDLQNLFAGYGTIIQTRILMDHNTGVSKGVGFVLFETKMMAEEAMNYMNNQTPEGATVPLSIKFADDNAKKVRAPAGGAAPTQGSNYYQGYSRPRMPGGPMRAPGNRFRYNPMGGGGGAGAGGYYSGGYGAGNEAYAEDYGVEGDGYGGVADSYAADDGTGGYGAWGGAGGAGGYRGRGAGRGAGARGGPRGAARGAARGGARGAARGAARGGAERGYPAPRRPTGNPIRGTGYGHQGGQVAEAAADGYILFVYNIGTEAVENDLWVLFSPYGSVTKVNVIYDHAKNQCKGYGFVTMPDKAEADYAISCLDGMYYNGYTLQVSYKSDKK